MFSPSEQQHHFMPLSLTLCQVCSSLSRALGTSPPLMRLFSAISNNFLFPPNKTNSSLSVAAQSLAPVRSRIGDPSLAFSSQRLVEGWDLPQQEGSDHISSSRPPSGYGRQKRSRSIGQLEFLPVPAPSLSSSLSHPSIGPALSLSPTQIPSTSTSTSSYTEGCTRFSTLLLHSSYFQSVESSLPPPGDAVTRRRQRCRSGSFGYLLRHGCGCVTNSVSLKMMVCL